MAYGQNPYYYPQYPQAGAMPGQLETLRAPYQTQYPQPMSASPASMPQMQPQAQPTPQAGAPMQWVQGEAAAKAWSVPPGGSVVLWDSESPLIYIKSADQMGMPQMRTLRWEEYHPAPPQAQSAAGDFAPMDVVRDLEQKINALSARLDSITREANQKEVQ